MAAFLISTCNEDRIYQGYEDSLQGYQGDDRVKAQFSHPKMRREYSEREQELARFTMDYMTWEIDNLSGLLVNFSQLTLTPEEIDILHQQREFFQKHIRSINVKEQHYVPQFYLEKFVDQEGKLHVADTANKRILKPYTPAGVCYEKGFYSEVPKTLDNGARIWEYMFKGIEDKFSARYDKIVKEIESYGEISDDTRFDLAFFMAAQYLRTQNFRDNINHSMVETKKDQVRLNYLITKEHDPDHEMVKKIDGDPKLKRIIVEKDYSDLKIEVTTNTAHLSFLSFDAIEEFASQFMRKRWRFYIASEQLSFVTSDNPVLDLLPESDFRPFGAHIAQRDQFFPLTPKILIHMADFLAPEKKRGKAVPLGKGNQVKRQRVNDEIVAKHNLVRLSFSKFGYSPSDSELDPDLSGQIFAKYWRQLSHLFWKRGM